MKKIYSTFIVIAAAAISFSSCSKVEEQVEATSGKAQTVTFNAVTPETKTTFGAKDAGQYPTIWTDNDSEIKIAQNFSNGVNAAVTKISDAKSSFSASLTDDESGSYTFYAISPASAVVSGVTASYKSWNLEIPTTQTPTTTGPDEKAMILAASSATVTEFPSSVDLNFSHITAYLKMSILNLDLAVGDEVASILVSANNAIAYRHYYYVGGTKVGTLEGNSAQNAITVKTNSTSDIWVACAPMAAGTKLTIAVTTANSKVYTKENITIPAALASGHVGAFNVNFAGITPPEDKVYNLVTSYSELTEGSKVVLAAVGETAYAAGIGTTTSNFISAVSQSKSGDYSKITNPATTVDVFTIEAGATANTIALHGTNGYLYAKSTENNQMGIQETNDVNGYWTPIITDAVTGAISLIATGSSNRNYMHYHYNNGSPRFSCYASTSTVTDLQALYKLEGSGSGSSLITTYTVTYDGNGNTGGSAPASVVTPGAFTVAAAGTLEKTGYTFNGWNTAADGSGTAYAAGASATATADMTLYAQWTESSGTPTTSTYQHVFNAKPATGDNKTLSGVNWNITAENLNSYNSDYYAGVQIGTSKKNGNITLTSSSDWSYEGKTKVTEVRLWLNTGGSAVTPTVTIGGTSATSDGTTVTKNSSAKTDWTKASKVTFTPAAGGNTGVVVINVATEKAGYICAIEIDCE